MRAAPPRGHSAALCVGAAPLPAPSRRVPHRHLAGPGIPHRALRGLRERHEALHRSSARRPPQPTGAAVKARGTGRPGGGSAGCQGPRVGAEGGPRAGRAGRAGRRDSRASGPPRPAERPRCPPRTPPRRPSPARPRALRAPSQRRAAAAAAAMFALRSEAGGGTGGARRPPGRRGAQPPPAGPRRHTAPPARRSAAPGPARPGAAERCRLFHAALRRPLCCGLCAEADGMSGAEERCAGLRAALGWT